MIEIKGEFAQWQTAYGGVLNYRGSGSTPPQAG
jgi:hypothetical protein